MLNITLQIYIIYIYIATKTKGNVKILTLLNGLQTLHDCTPTALRPTSADLGRLHGAKERGEAAHAYFLAVLGIQRAVKRAKAN